MSKEFNVKQLINDKYGLEISNRAISIFIIEYQIEGEDFITTKNRILNDLESFYQFVLLRTDLPITLKNNAELLENYLDEINFIGKSIVTLKNYSAGNVKIQNAIPELELIYSDYKLKIEKLIDSIGLDPNYGSSKIRSRRPSRK